MTFPTDSTPYVPGSWDDVDADGNDYISASFDGTYSGPETVFESGAAPGISEGEMYAYKARITLFPEPSDDKIVFALMDGDENTYLQKSVIPQNDGMEAEIITLLDHDMSGSGSNPFASLAIEVPGSDVGNYFIDVRVIRVRAPRDATSRTPSNTIWETQWNFDGF